MARLESVTIDCADAESLTQFWLEALEGYTVDPEWKVVLKSPDGPTLYFQQVPEPKVAKNRVHLDLTATDREAEVDRLTGYGASVMAEKDEQGFRWTVMQDPEGNEFCVVQRQ